MSALAQYGKRGLLLIGGGYLAAVNAAAVALFYYDKQQATTHGWRVPEATLQASALLGGWAGGLWAMEKFRHKTKKQPFRTIYFSAVGLNVVGLAGGFYYLNKNGSVDVNQMLRSPLGKEVTKLIKKNIKTPRL